MNKKQSCVISCPIDVYSGYSSRSRDFVKSLIALKGEEWDIKILSQRWGDCPFGYLEDHNETDLASRIIPNLTQQPDIWFQISISSEFQAVGRFNVGVTAGMETTLCAPQWIEGCNRMNLVIVSSEHAKKVFETSQFEKKNHMGHQVEIIKLNTPVEVLFEGVNTDIFKKLDIIPDCTVNEKLKTIPENFCFLFTGHYLQGDIGHDRKNVSGLIKTFLETFANKKNPPALILKTQGATPSEMDKEEILRKINTIRKMVSGSLPNIYLIHGTLSDEEMNALYNHPKVKAHISFTKGEGFGRPLLESTISQKPLITTNYSGHLDFLNPEFVTLLQGKIEQVHPSATIKDMILPESGWFEVDYKYASKIMSDVVLNYKDYLVKAKRQAYLSRTTFSLDSMTTKLGEIVENKFPKPIQLPVLKKIVLPKLEKINE